jgi:hypothetical protein
MTMIAMGIHIHAHGPRHIVTILILVFETIHHKAYQFSIAIMECLIYPDGTDHHERNQQECDESFHWQQSYKLFIIQTILFLFLIRKYHIHGMQQPFPYRKTKRHPHL